MLEIHSLNQYYGGSHILRHIHGNFETGKLTVLLGRNGVGKTTLLRCLMGLLPIRSASISCWGTPLWQRWTLPRHAPWPVSNQPCPAFFSPCHPPHHSTTRSP